MCTYENIASGCSFFVCSELLPGGAGQAGQGQERQGGVEGYAGVGGLGRTLGIVGLSIGGRVVVIAAGGGRGPHGIQRQRPFISVSKFHASEVPFAAQYIKAWPFAVAGSSGFLALLSPFVKIGWKVLVLATSSMKLTVL